METATSSCSTASPPTPGSENDSSIIIGDGFAVSIEPIYRGVRRKRGRNDDESITGRPAFFQHFHEEIKPMEPPDIANVSKKIDDNANQAKYSFNHETNNDPAMCSFEVAIIKRRHIFSSSVLGMDCRKKDALNTPTARTTIMDIDEDDIDEIYDLNSKILLFRFGSYFVFEANPSAIVKVEHQSGYGEGAKKQNDDQITSALNVDNTKQLGDRAEEAECTKISDGSHQSKRQRTENHINDASTKRFCPASLCISFPSCTFRVFSVENCKESNKVKSSSEWNKRADAQNRLLSAQSKILQQIDIRNRDAVPWASSPFESIEAEKWSSCLDRNHKPSQKVSPTKTDSSSTHFENGQNQLSDLKAIENNDSDPNVHEGGEVEGSGKHPENLILNRIKSSQQKSSENSSGQKDPKTENVMDASKCKHDSYNNLSSQKSFMNEISNKRLVFDHSWSVMQDSVSISSNFSLLTSCAESLNHSYCDLKQRSNFTHQCDSEIDTATSDVEMLLEEMMPVRGKCVARGKQSAPTLSESDKLAEQDVDLEQKVDNLLRLRKAMVAAKYSLFLVPKR